MFFNLPLTVRLLLPLWQTVPGETWRLAAQLGFGSGAVWRLIEWPLLLLDEPFAALGPALRAEMLALVERLRRDQNLTVVLVSHHPDDARRIAGRCAFVHDGRILAVDRTAELLDRTTLPELRAYLGDVEPG